MKTKIEPEIMGVMKEVFAKFGHFILKNLYFVVALFAMCFFYKYLLMRFSPGGGIGVALSYLIDITIYPVVMVFIMYLVNAYYANKKITDLRPIIEEGKTYLQPLMGYYVLVLLTMNVIGMFGSGMLILALIIFIKLMFVDQLIYYKNLTVMEAIKSSFAMVGIKLFFTYFIFAIIAFSMVNAIMNFLIPYSPSNAMFIAKAVEVFVVLVIRFFVTVSYRELIKIDFYRSKS
ncbi:MAG: hypothetical protein RLN62_05670 [Rickettsiales bacterium]